MNIAAISSGLKLGYDGIWYSSEDQSVSYPSDGNERYFALENASFWFRHRNHCIVSAVNSFPPPGNGTIFDIGGGNGFVSSALSKAGFDVALVEPGRVGASNAKKRGVETVICATTATARFEQRSLPAVGLFDVIEHVDDDVSFLQSIRILMKHGGLLYVTVPAFPCLWSKEDVHAGHFRRYTLRGICKTLTSSGYQVVFASHIFRFLPLPLFLLRTLPHKVGLSGKQRTPATLSRNHAVQSTLFTRLMNELLKPEIVNLKNKRAMSFGASCLAVARCP